MENKYSLGVILDFFSYFNLMPEAKVTNDHWYTWFKCLISYKFIGTNNW